LKRATFSLGFDTAVAGCGLESPVLSTDGWIALEFAEDLIDLERQYLT